MLIGDFNDGPFADEIEAEYLLYNIVDELRGSFLEPAKLLTHAMDAQTQAAAWTVEFPDPMKEGQSSTELVDHILVTPSLVSGTGYLQLRLGSSVVETPACDLHTRRQEAPTIAVCVQVTTDRCRPGSSTRPRARRAFHVLPESGRGE